MEPKYFKCAKWGFNPDRELHCNFNIEILIFTIGETLTVFNYYFIHTLSDNQPYYWARSRAGDINVSNILWPGDEALRPYIHTGGHLFG